MLAFKITMLEAITLGIGSGIGYVFNKTGLKLWRMFVGFLVAFVVGWIAGVFTWAFVFMSNDPKAVIDGMPKSFLFAIVGAGIGVYFGRRKVKAQVQKCTTRGEEVGSL